MMYSKSLDLCSVSSVYTGHLAKGKAATMTKAQQTHDIFSVYCVWAIAGNPEFFTSETE